MIIKTTRGLEPPTGHVVAGVGLRVVKEQKGYKVTYGEHTGSYVPADAVMTLDVEHKGERPVRRG